MCAENTARQAAPADHGREEKRSAASRVASLPLVSSACAAAAAAYARAEQRHPYVGALCAAAAKGARTLTAAAATGARPVLAKLEPRIATANRFACKGLDKLEEKLPILQQPSEKVVAETRMLVSSAVTGAREAASGVVGTARGAVQGGVERTRAALSAGVGTVVGSPVGRMVVTGVETVLGKSEELLDRYLPMTDEELAKLTAAVQGFETAPAERRQSYAARLGSLSAKLQHRALQHSLGGLRSARRSLARLQHIRQLVARVKQGTEGRLRGARRYLRRLWLQPDPSEAAADARVAPAGSRRRRSVSAAGVSRLAASQVEAGALLWLARWLRAVCARATAGRVREAQATVSRTRSFHDLSDLVVAQSRRRMTQAQVTIDELLDYVAQHAPLPWLVGPFAPVLVEYPEDSLVDMAKWDGCLAIGGSHRAPGSPRLCSEL
ncbi:perilipin-3-like isoform X2 [Struthio camelus]|uniref:perilipin-3-like isoform X2 n=1 Tax=Struthio camelus TaxID=8801 RepID=UPI003603D5F0